MDYTDADLRRRIGAAVNAALENNPTTTQQIIDQLFVQLKPLVEDERRAYTITKVKEMLSGIL